MAKRRNVKIDEKRELDAAVPVGASLGMFDDDGPDFVEQEPIVTKRPIVFLTGKELRDAHVEILTLRVLKQPIPDWLMANDRLDVCGLRACRLLMAMMTDEGVSDPSRVREFANRVIPVLPG